MQFNKKNKYGKYLNVTDHSPSMLANWTFDDTMEDILTRLKRKKLNPYKQGFIIHRGCMVLSASLSSVTKYYPNRLIVTVGSFNPEKNWVDYWGSII